MVYITDPVIWYYIADFLSSIISCNIIYTGIYQSIYCIHYHSWSLSASSNFLGQGILKFVRRINWKLHNFVHNIFTMSWLVTCEVTTFSWLQFHKAERLFYHKCFHIVSGIIGILFNGQPERFRSIKSSTCGHLVFWVPNTKFHSVVEKLQQQFCGYQ